ncbi:MAG: 6-bladed beta-propeller [Acidobacteria bacterium]|nr:6-bladed beta-propeller [Acidobacteriota bacterium]
MAKWLPASAILLAAMLAPPQPGVSAEDAPQPPSPVQRVRAFPQLKLQNGSTVTYAGVFAADGRFRPAFKGRRLSIEPDAGLADEENRVGMPPEALHSWVRLIQDWEPPAHVVSLPEPQSLTARTMSSVATAVYGHRIVLHAPVRVTTDSKQRLIISDPGIPAVTVLDPAKENSFSILGGPGRRLQWPAGVASDAEDNIYVADSKRGVLLVFDRDGSFVRSIGAVERGESRYHSPAGIAIDAQAGTLYMAEPERNLVYVMDLQGNVQRVLGEQEATEHKPVLQRRERIASGLFTAPTEIAVGKEAVAILDSGGSRVTVVDRGGNVVSAFPAIHPHFQPLNGNYGMAVDKHGNIYISFVGSSEIDVFDPQGKLLGGFGKAGARAGEFFPRGLWVDARDRLYVSDTQNQRVQMFQLGAR